MSGKGKQPGAASMPLAGEALENSGRPRPTVLYHAAPAQFRDQIRNQGLRTDVRRNFGSAYEYPSGVYMVDSLDASQQWVNWHEDFGPMDIWRVDAVGLEVHGDPDQEPAVEEGWFGLDGGSYYSSASVPSSRLTLVEAAEEVAPWTMADELG